MPLLSVLEGEGAGLDTWLKDNTIWRIGVFLHDMHSLVIPFYFAEYLKVFSRIYHLFSFFLTFFREVGSWMIFTTSGHFCLSVA